MPLTFDAAVLLPNHTRWNFKVSSIQHLAQGYKLYPALRQNSRSRSSTRRVSLAWMLSLKNSLCFARWLAQSDESALVAFSLNFITLVTTLNNDSLTDPRQMYIHQFIGIPLCHFLQWGANILR